MSTKITRALTIVRTGARENAIDVDVSFSPTGDEPTEWTDVTMSVFLIADAAPVQVDLDLVRDGESRAAASVPVGESFDVSGPVTMRAIIMHGTRSYGVREISV